MSVNSWSKATCREVIEVWGLQANGEMVLESSDRPKRVRHVYTTANYGELACELCGKRKPMPRKKEVAKWQCAVCKKPSPTHVAFCSKACEWEAIQYAARVSKEQTRREKEFGKTEYHGSARHDAWTRAFDRYEYKWNGELNDRP